MVCIDIFAHKLQRVEMKLIAFKLARQVVEVYHVLVAELHELDNLLRLVV